MAEARCPDCGSAQLRDLGALPDVQHFAGRRQVSAMPGGRLLNCRGCDLRFRFPVLTCEQYATLYDNGDVDVWQVAAQRNDQALVMRELERHVRGASVLDFGCYSGEFLRSLDGQFRKFGVEVNRTAADLAARRASARVETDLDAFEADLTFDFIVAMDVVEHVISPRLLVERLLGRLAPGGRLVLTTGDGGNRLWSVLGAHWWYCYFPEHVAFLSRRWFAFHAGGLGAEVERLDAFSYIARSPITLVRGMLRLAFCALLPNADARSRRRRSERLDRDDGAPGIGLSRDHLLVVLRHAPA